MKHPVGTGDKRVKVFLKPVETVAHSVSQKLLPCITDQLDSRLRVVFGGALGRRIGCDPINLKSSVEGGEDVPAGVALPRWLCWCGEWMEHTLIAPHTKFQMQRRCSGGDRSESHPSRPLLRS